MSQNATRFGKYILLHRIAVGGMAEIFVARQLGLEGFEKIISIKRIRSHLSSQPNFVKMFLNEAKLAAQLNHPNIVQIYDLGRVVDSYFIAMEYVSGRDMSRVIPQADRKEIPFPIVYALKIASMALEGLYHAHTKTDSFGNPLGIVHRDVTPENIIVGYNGTVKLADFGIAKANTQIEQTKAGEIKGKLSYMSPEQAMGEKLDHRSDIFSLGAILYEWMTHTKLFTGENEMAILKSVIEGKIYPPSYFNKEIPKQVEAILMKALDKDREKRYQNASDMKYDIENYLSQKEFNPSTIHISNFMKQLFSEEIEQEKELLRRSAQSVSNSQWQEFDVYQSSIPPEHVRSQISQKSQSSESVDDEHMVNVQEITDGGSLVLSSSEGVVASLVSDLSEYAHQLNLEFNEHDYHVLSRLAQRNGMAIKDLLLEMVRSQIKWME
jgi:eukaryotic-like serine/threonine-protein kinase